LQHHAAVHISVTFGTVCHVSVASGKSSHFSIALQDMENVLIIVVFSKNTLLQLAEKLLEALVIDDLANVPNPFAKEVDVVAICKFNNLTLSTELVDVDVSATLELPWNIFSDAQIVEDVKGISTLLLTTNTPTAVVDSVGKIITEDCLSLSPDVTTPDVVAKMEDATLTRLPADAVEEIVAAKVDEPLTLFIPTPATLVVDIVALLANVTLGTTVVVLACGIATDVFLVTL
jgi:hypothetical protein